MEESSRCIEKGNFFPQRKEKKRRAIGIQREVLLHVLQGQCGLNGSFCFWLIPRYKGGVRWTDKKRERKRRRSNGRHGFSYVCPVRYPIACFGGGLFLSPGQWFFSTPTDQFLEGGKEGYCMCGSNSCDPRRNHTSSIINNHTLEALLVLVVLVYYKV